MRSLRRAAGRFRNLARADGSPPGAHDGLSLSRSYEGRFVIDGEYTDVAAETIATAIHAYTDRQPTPAHRPHEPGVARWRGPARPRWTVSRRRAPTGLAIEPSLTTVGTSWPEPPPG
jgi:hypothetical protein